LTVVTVRIDAHDFKDVLLAPVGSAELHWWNSTMVETIVGMTDDGWALGSNHRFFTDTSITEAVNEVVEYWVVVTDGNGNTYDDSGTPRTITFASGAIAPNFPYDIKGFAHLYNGSHAVGYNPVNIPGATVVLETTNTTGVFYTDTQVTDGLGRYLFVLQPDNYTIGGMAWVNFTITYGASTFYDYQTTVCNIGGGESWVNGTGGIPAFVNITWIPWWDGILPAPLPNTYPAGGPFWINVTITDVLGSICPGYYCYMQLETNETSLAQDLWTLGPGPVTIVFDGIGGAVSPFGAGDGYWNNTCVLNIAGVWAMWANATDGIGNPMTNLTWWDPVLPNGPQYEPANATWNYTHVLIVAGGFHWRPVVGWNLISIPKNISFVFGLALDASEAAQLVEDAALGAGIVITEIVLSEHQPGSYPASYNTWTHGVGGIDFAMSIDYSYWLYVDADLSAEGVFVQGANHVLYNDELENWGETAGWVNTVTLNAGYTMVNPSAAWWNCSAWNGTVSWHIDTRGNNGTWSNMGTYLHTGCGWVGGSYIPWYGQDGTLP
ncbi:MAG: hypothetical protein KAX31_04975, partial [Thermoplasmata archaeon]|nr:hypothetical protein [Thermoplasmata archaeon]